MKLYKPLQISGYFLGVFPCIENNRFRVHWIGVILKVVFKFLYWNITFNIFERSLKVISIRPTIKSQKFTPRVLNIDTLYAYMLFSEILAALVCQLQFFRPSVYRVVNDCFFQLCRLDDILVFEQYFAAFSVVILCLYELAMYFVLINKLVSLIHIYMYSCAVLAIITVILFDF